MNHITMVTASATGHRRHSVYAGRPLRVVGGMAGLKLGRLAVPLGGPQMHRRLATMKLGGLGRPCPLRFLLRLSGVREGGGLAFPRAALALACVILNVSLNHSGQQQDSLSCRR